MTAEKPKRLSPARPDAQEAASYMPRVPWRVTLLGVVSVAVVIAGYQWKERRKADELRAAIVRVHEGELGEARTAYLKLRHQVEGLVQSAAGMETSTFVDPRLHIPGLRSGQGLYLRLPLRDAQNRANIGEAAKAMDTDLIATCMGLAPVSARSIYEKGEFLMPSWLGETKRLTDVMHLRVREEMLARHMRADLPSVLGLLRSDWFMLVLQEGPNRKVAPVRVFLWDLKRGQPLLRARVQAEGVLINTRVLSKDAPYSPKLAEQGSGSGGANDCSISSQLKELASPEARTPRAHGAVDTGPTPSELLEADPSWSPIAAPAP